MNTTYFLNLVSGNVFGSKKTPALPEKYYLGLSSAVPALDGSGVVEPGEGAGYARVELTSWTGVIVRPAKSFVVKPLSNNARSTSCAINPV